MSYGEMSAEGAVRTGAAGRTDTVAVLGAGGTMGFSMARNIARAGPAKAPASMATTTSAPPT